MPLKQNEENNNDLARKRGTGRSFPCSEDIALPLLENSKSHPPRRSAARVDSNSTNGAVLHPSAPEPKRNGSGSPPKSPANGAVLNPTVPGEPDVDYYFEIGGEYFLTRKQVAKRLRISERWAFNWSRDGILPEPAEMGKRKLWRLSDLTRWLVEGGSAPRVGRPRKRAKAGRSAR
jgi:hypothetical protein